MAASLAAPDAARRDQFLNARGNLSQIRLDISDAERRKDAEAKLKEINDLKARARAELAAIEARANSRPLSDDEKRNTVDWFDSGADKSVSGILVRVDCPKGQLLLNVREDSGAVQVILVKDPAQLVVQGGEFSASCGVQKPRRVIVGYTVPKTLPKGVAGEATGLELN